MTFEEAVEALSFHAGANDHLDPRWAAGFMQTLRPYRGTLDTEAMDEVNQCVDAVALHLARDAKLDRSVINSLWDITHLTRAWALHPDGMLRRNNLISSEDQDALGRWVDALTMRISFLFAGGYEEDLGESKS